MTISHFICEGTFWILIIQKTTRKNYKINNGRRYKTRNNNYAVGSVI